jgi:hypothetical protein
MASEFVAHAVAAACLLSTVAACHQTTHPLLPAPDARAAQADRHPARPLSVFAGNPRYFGDGTRAVYLTGSHTWNNFQDWDGTIPLRLFDFDGYLDFLERHHHNFIRLYVWEQAAWFPGSEVKVVIDPLPYLRTGPGEALDGGPRFDLERFNPEYFGRLRDRVERAGARGIYVSVMLFDGWSVELKGQKTGNPWRGHPMNRENNVNGIDGDLNGDGEGGEVHTLANPAVTRLQRAYVRKVVETLSDLNNVLYEISNESDAASIAWQYEMIRTTQSLESHLGKRHPVGMTAPWPVTPSGNAALFASPADWISPHSDGKDLYDTDPPAGSGEKVVLLDTDHIWGLGGSPRWVFESLLRGLNPVFMDACVTETRRFLPVWSPEKAHTPLPAPCPPSDEWESTRLALGWAHALADEVDLASLRPMDDLASTHYCLADPGKEYLVLLPWDGGRRRILIGRLFPRLVAERVSVDLSAARRPLDVEWVDIRRGVRLPGEPVVGGQRLEFQGPFAGDAILHIKAGAGH